MSRDYKIFRFCFCFFLCWNLAFCAEIPRFSFYSPLSDQELQEFVMSEKFDGVRGIWNGEILTTRNFHKIEAPKFWLKNFPPFVLDGELWLGYGSFEEISGIVREKNPSAKWENIKYLVFDVRNVCNGCALQERLERLQEYLRESPNPFIEIIPQIPIQNGKHLENYYQEVIQRKGEGVILRKDSDSNIGYKLKAFNDAECIVKGYTQGKGRNQGKMGAVICEAEINGILRSFKIGSGFSDRERENPPSVGARITYQFQGYTKNGIPRFPIFLRVRPLE